MHLTVTHYERRRGTRTFTTRSREGTRVEVQEWEYFSPAAAEEVLGVELARGEYEQLVASHGGDERRAQELILGAARRQREHHVWPAQHRLPRLDGRARRVTGTAASMRRLLVRAIHHRDRLERTIC
jgi:hypothetical protein